MPEDIKKHGAILRHSSDSRTVLWILKYFLLSAFAWHYDDFAQLADIPCRILGRGAQIAY